MSSSLDRSSFEIVSRIPLIILWNWLNLLPFSIENQRHPCSIQEDKLNKPWRPIVAGRLSPEDAKIWTRTFYVISISIGLSMGLVTESLLMIPLGWIYNCGGGAFRSPFIRSFSHMMGYWVFFHGSHIIALGSSQTSTTTQTLAWTVFVSFVLGATVTAADLPDVEGDAAIGRRTIPIVFGDQLARMSLALTVIVLSIISCIWWQTRLVGWGFVGMLASKVARRTLLLRSTEEDKMTQKMWYLWMMALYVLPLV